MNIVLTGGHTGMGLELSKLLLDEGHALSLIVRTEKRQAEAEQTLAGSGKVHFHLADLSVQADVRRVGEEIVARGVPVGGLFNNAGVLLDGSYRSAQDNEMHYEVNSLAPYILTTTLWPALEQSSSPFVVNTATGSMEKRKAIDMQDLKTPIKFRKLLGSYMESKMAMIALMNHLAQEKPDLLMAHVNPGAIKTKMTAGKGMPFFLKPIRRLFFSEPIVGAKKLRAAAFRSELRGRGGVFLDGDKLKPIKLALSEQDFQELLAGIQP